MNLFNPDAENHQQALARATRVGPSEADNADQLLDEAMNLHG